MAEVKLMKNNLAAARSELRLSLRELAKKSGVPRLLN